MIDEVSKFLYIKTLEVFYTFVHNHLYSYALLYINSSQKSST